MIIDKDKITTQDELDEPAPIEQADARVKAKMKQLRGKTARSKSLYRNWLGYIQISHSTPILTNSNTALDLKYCRRTRKFNDII